METPEIHVLWAAYESAEKDRIREISFSRLNDLIEELKLLSESERHGWARKIARNSIDENLETPIRLPLFRDILFPALLSGLRAEAPGCARWLAGLSHLLCNCPTCLSQLMEHERGQANLLREALRIDPGDKQARRMLIEELEYWLGFAIHEVPAGILWDNRDATIEQCAQLEQELDEFERLAAEDGRAEEKSDFIAECRFHFRSYPDYLSKGSQYDSYADYLDATSSSDEK